MSDKELIDDVAKLRKAQKGFFTTPKSNTIERQHHLQQSKQLEDKIDRELKVRGYAI